MTIPGEHPTGLVEGWEVLGALEGAFDGLLVLGELVGAIGDVDGVFDGRLVVGDLLG